MRFNEEDLVPYLQPIFSVDNGQVYGYEILGRLIEGDKVKSLGAFFGDESVSQDEKREADRVIRYKGMREFAENGREGQYIFVNMRFCWLEPYEDCPEKMPTVIMARELGIDYKRIVIEISEHDFIQLDTYHSSAIAYYKKLGIRIAVDDYGAEKSNINRFVELSPEIVKIDMDIVQKSEMYYQYREYLRCTTDLCETLGVEVIYEGMENGVQLKNCMRSGGRFYQGFFLSKPLASIKTEGRDTCMGECLFDFVVAREQSNISARALISRLDAFSESLLSVNFKRLGHSDVDCEIHKLAPLAPTEIIRIFLCNKDGFQISSNIVLYGDRDDTAAFNKNWAWRGYFRNALKSISNTGKSYISEEYRDISRKNPIVTYVRSVSPDIYLFIDIASGANTL